MKLHECSSDCNDHSTPSPPPQFQRASQPATSSHAHPKFQPKSKSQTNNRHPLYTLIHEQSNTINMANGCVLLFSILNMKEKITKANANPVRSWSIIVGLVLIAVFSVVSWFASPKGENQT